MYFHVLNTEMTTIGVICANNYNDACRIAAELYPKYAFVTECTHQQYHSFKPRRDMTITEHTILVLVALVIGFILLKII